MKDPRVAENCKAVTLDNGKQMLYCEFGEENKEVIVTGAFYFITFNAVLKPLAKRYHVYGFVMDMNSEGATQLNADGTINWVRQWGSDIYQATQKLGLDKFHFVGKCHGVMAGWYMLKNHPEVLLSLSSLSMTAHAFKADADNWFGLQAQEGPLFSLRMMKKHQNLLKKVEEAKSVGTTVSIGEQKGDSKILGYYGSHPEEVCDSLEECQEFLKNIKTPVFFLFPTEDVLYGDFKSSNEFAMHQIPGARSVLLQGERHLLEMDMPLLLAREVEFFIEGTKLPYE